MKVKASKKIKPIIYYLALASSCLSLCACNPNLYSVNGINPNTITAEINIDDYKIEYDNEESDYMVVKNKMEKPYKSLTYKSRLYLKEAIYVSSNPSEYGYNPVGLDTLNKYSVYYINQENQWILPYLEDMNYTCKNIAIKKYVDEQGEEYILYHCDVYVVNDFDNGKTIELSGKVWPIQDIAYEVPIAPVESFYVNYESLSKVGEDGLIYFIADKQDGFDNTCVNGKLDDYLIERKELGKIK